MKLELQSVLEQRRQNNKLKTDNILPVPWVEFKDTYEKAFAEIDPYKTDYLAISAGNSFSSKVCLSEENIFFLSFKVFKNIYQQTLVTL